MLVVGIVLFIIGALVALAAGSAGVRYDGLVRLLGVGLAIVGLALIIVAVLPSDAHAAAAMMVVPTWRFRSGRITVERRLA